MKLRKLSKFFIAGFTLLFATNTYAGSAWDMPTPYPDKTFHTKNIAQFAKDVEMATNGEFKLKLHTAGSLFKHPEISKAVRSGQVNIGEFFLSLLNNDNAIFGADSLPFLATNYEQAEKLWDAQKPIVTKLLAKQGLMPLFSVPWPPQNLYSKEEIKSSDDLKGLKFRSYNAMLEKLAGLIGAAPTQVEVPDIAQAFTTGRVEAMITSPSTGANSKAWDYIDHYTKIRGWLPKNIVVVNVRAFRKLDDDVKEAILKAADAAEKRGWEMSIAETSTNEKVLEDNGMMLHEPTNALVSSLKAAGGNILDDWKVQAGDDGKALLDAFNN